MLQYDDWSSLLIASVIKTLQELGGSTWGYVIQENWGFVYDLEAAIENMADSSIQVLQRTVDDSGIKISATVGADITELTEVTQLVCNLLTPVGELLLVFLAIYDEEALRYWFVIGTPSHGHIGEIRIERDSIPQIELPKLN